MLSYIIFAITTLFFLGLSLLTASRPNLSGDNAMGYGLGLAVLGLSFAVSGLALTLTILAKNGFQWVASDASLRSATVLLAWLCIAATTFFCAMFKWEWHSDDDNTYPQFLQWLALHHGQLWIPLLWLVTCFLSLGGSWQTTLVLITYKIPFFISLLISVVYSGGLVVGYFRDSARQALVKQAGEQEQQDRWRQQTLDFIATQTPNDPMIHLLIHTGQFQPTDVRQAAIAKVKAHPEWEAELLALLKHKQTYRQVYYFLDGNSVTNKKAFAEALNQSILWLAETIKTNIKESNNLQTWSFDSDGIDELCQAIDGQFQNKGVDFRSNVQQLSQALKTSPPDRFKDVRFNVTREVDTWLNQHK
ncbi:hypothetical protein IC229_35010 [Spirosoma sp. BT702]|uniref:Uncharacterized protein n=1 Tax=Spirosoma profusum TaxID=2771354 RepID=A0A927GAX2_9BACT|nr:hypothetical protein [Spirosoma profusum]MBD2705861.1 hypothetical protein [Spirosoma profusum]